MTHVSYEAFQELVQASVDDIPGRFKVHLNNVAFMVAESPSAEQLEEHGMLHGGGLLLGLYEGIPLPARDDGYSGVLPDLITVFKRSHEAVARDASELRELVHQTVWHEVAHYFGLDHGQIAELEQNE
jgi:predicted Zn-dependent protease with MMP-like domain